MLHRRPSRRLFTLVATAAVVASASAPSHSWDWGSGERVKGSGEVSSESRDLGGFDGVSMVGGYKVVIRQGSATKVEVTADKNLLALIETRVVDGGKGRTLEIGPKRGYNLSTTVTPLITLEMPQLRAVSVAGSGEVKVEVMKTAAVDASIAGSGDVRFADLTSERLGLKVSGSGDILVAGRSGMLTASIAGSGNVRAKDLVAEEVKVSIAGSGDAQVHASKKLHVSVAGSGDVAYLGSPEVSSSIAGSGRVRKLGN